MNKTILCYGDSNTYGYNPVNGLRYPKEVRWTGCLQKLLGVEYSVIEEGCNGRTTVFDDPLEGWKNGLDYLKPCLNSHKPIDIVILMLGSNDLKTTFHATAKKIAEGLEILVDTIKTFTKNKQGFEPVIILLSPPEIGQGICNSSFRYAFDDSAISRSKELPDEFCQVAKRKGCIFCKTSDYIKPSQEDALHLMPEGHKKLANILKEIIVQISV
ncbi:MAG: SGNH/GDSL hydrolase family protein [Eubacterium sp.]